MVIIILPLQHLWKTSAPTKPFPWALHISMKNVKQKYFFPSSLVWCYWVSIIISVLPQSILIGMQSKINGFFVAFQSKGEKQTLTPHHQRIRQTALKDCIVSCCSVCKFESNKWSNTQMYKISIGYVEIITS